MLFEQQNCGRVLTTISNTSPNVSLHLGNAKILNQWDAVAILPVAYNTLELGWLLGVAMLREALLLSSLYSH